MQAYKSSMARRRGCAAAEDPTSAVGSGWHAEEERRPAWSGSQARGPEERRAGGWGQQRQARLAEGGRKKEREGRRKRKGEKKTEGRKKKRK
jgi:hypothetical protein